MTMPGVSAVGIRYKVQDKLERLGWVMIVPLPCLEAGFGDELVKGDIVELGVGCRYTLRGVCYNYPFEVSLP